MEKYYLNLILMIILLLSIDNSLVKCGNLKVLMLFIINKIKAYYKYIWIQMFLLFNHKYSPKINNYQIRNTLIF